MLQAIIDQFAYHPVKDHLNIGIEPLVFKVCFKHYPHFAARQFIDKVRNGPRQTEVIQHMRTQVCGNLAEAADRLIHDVVNIADNLLILLAHIRRIQRRNGHFGRRKQRSQTVVQVLRKALPLFFLGTQYGIEDPALGNAALALGAGNVIEDFVNNQDTSGETERGNDTQPNEKFLRQMQLFHMRHLDVLAKTQAGQPCQSHRKEHPREVILSLLDHPDGHRSRTQLQDDRNDKQYFNNHTATVISQSKITNYPCLPKPRLFVAGQGICYREQSAATACHLYSSGYSRIP